MEAIRVRYQVRPEYAETNRANIQRVMVALQAKPIPGLRYSAFCEPDGHSFIHLVIAKDEETRQKIQDLPEFQSFQKALMESQPTMAPEATDMSVVGTSHSL